MVNTQTVKRIVGDFPRRYRAHVQNDHLYIHAPSFVSIEIEAIERIDNHTASFMIWFKDSLSYISLDKKRLDMTVCIAPCKRFKVHGA